MNPDAQRKLVHEHLARRERIALDTKAQLDELAAREPSDPLARVDPAIRRAAEDEFYAQQGKHRYETSDGRTLFLTPEEIATRRRARSSGRAPGGEDRSQARYYGPSGDRDRRWLSWGFNALAVLLALAVVYVILH